VKRWLKWTLLGVGSLVLLGGASFAWMASRVRPALEIGRALPAATFTDAAGKPVDLASFRGKPLFLDFWRST
jgi:cytochrome oxidase Cu insertion factor (SCO1/SenC/PrrC family)